MGIGCRRRNKPVFAVILGVLCFEMLFAETHGMRGHTAYTSTSATKPFEYSAPSRSGLTASARESDDPSCNLCFCYRLLSQSIIPQACCIVDSPFIIRTTLIHRFDQTQTSPLQAGNRSPPQA